MNYEIPIPSFYLDITKGYTMRATMFKQYVICYLEVSFPEMHLVKIEGMKAICERR